MIFTGEAKNAWGHAYRDLGVMDCALVTARLLGPQAKPLERHLRQALHMHPVYASAALGALGALDDESISDLAQQVATADAPHADWNTVSEAAAALCRCGAQRHPLVLQIIASSTRAMRALESASASV